MVVNARLCSFDGALNDSLLLLSSCPTCDFLSLSDGRKPHEMGWTSLEGRPAEFVLHVCIVSVRAWIFSLDLGVISDIFVWVLWL